MHIVHSKGPSETQRTCETRFWISKKIHTCASSPHINAKLHDVPAQHEKLRQAQYHANLDYDAAPKWIAIGSDECTSSNGGGVRETPPTQQNRNNISKFWLITKTAKISTQGREPVTPDLLVLDFNGAPEAQVQRRR